MYCKSVMGRGKIFQIIQIMLTMAVVYVEFVDGQCGDKFKTITSGSGSIQSPNFGSEYGQSANCNWNFNPVSSGKALILTVTKLKLYLIIDSSKVCTGSYNLTIDNRSVRCDRYVNVPTASFCKSFYSNPSCRVLSEVKSCESLEQKCYPVNVKYRADGRTYGINPEGSALWGFKINYEFVECPSTSTTLSESISSKVGNSSLESVSSASSASVEISTGYSPTAIEGSCTTTLIIAVVISSVSSIILTVIVTLLIQHLLQLRGKVEKSNESLKQNDNFVLAQSLPGEYDNPDQRAQEPAYEEASYEVASLKYDYEDI